MIWSGWGGAPFSRFHPDCVSVEVTLVTNLFCVVYGWLHSFTGKKRDFYLDGAFVPLEGDVWALGEAGSAVDAEVDVWTEVDVWKAGGTGLAAGFEPATGNALAARSIPWRVVSKYCTTAETEVSR